MRALASAIGFPRRPTSASSMLALLTPEEVRRSFMRPPGVAAAGESALGAYGSVRAGDWHTTEKSSLRATTSLTSLGRHSRTPAEGVAPSSDLEFTRDQPPKLLETARSPASALPARPSALHRCAARRRCRNGG